MDDILKMDNVKPGDEVFVIYRNPHVPSVSNVKSAEIVQHPKDSEKLALFIHETLHVIEDDDALFATSEAAERFLNAQFARNEY